MQNDAAVVMVYHTRHDVDATRALLERAIELDARLPDGYAVRGLARLWLAGDAATSFAKGARSEGSSSRSGSCCSCSAASPVRSRHVPGGGGYSG